jgi:hypothetical protein
MAETVLDKLIFAELARSSMHCMEYEDSLLFPRFLAWLFVVLFVGNVFLLTAPAELCGVNQGECTSAFGMLSTPYPLR